MNYTELVPKVKLDAVRKRNADARVKSKEKEYDKWLYVTKKVAQQGIKEPNYTEEIPATHPWVQAIWREYKRTSLIESIGKQL